MPCMPSLEPVAKLILRYPQFKADSSNNNNNNNSNNNNDNYDDDDDDDDDDASFQLSGWIFVSLAVITVIQNHVWILISIGTKSPGARVIRGSGRFCRDDPDEYLVVNYPRLSSGG